MSFNKIRTGWYAEEDIKPYLIQRGEFRDIPNSEIVGNRKGVREKGAFAGWTRDADNKVR